MPFGQFEALKPDLEMMPGMKSWRDKQHQEVPLTESPTRRLMFVFREASTSPTSGTETPASGATRRCEADYAVGRPARPHLPPAARGFMSERGRVLSIASMLEGSLRRVAS